jgi:hypothetical protein
MMAVSAYPRSRVSDDVDYGVRHYTETAFNGSSTTATTPHRAANRGDYNATFDWVSPGYRSRVARGEVINHSYSNRKVKYNHYWTGFKYQRNSGSGATIKTFEGDLWYTSPALCPIGNRPAGVPLSALKAEAGTKALAALNSSDIQGLVEIAEAHKVRDTLRPRIDGLNRHLYRELSRTKPLSAKAITALGGINKVITANWLRYRYGIMPIMYLIEDAVVGPKIKLVRDTARGSASYSDSGVWTESKSGNFYQDLYTVNWLYECQVSAGILYRPDWSLNRYGISFKEIPGAAIELIPYSFVADWFVNLSPFVNSIVMPLGVKQLASWTVVRETYSSTCDVESTWIGSSSYTNVKSTSGGYAIENETTNRHPGVSRGLVPRWTSIKQIGSDKRLFDAYALACNLFPRLITASWR